MPSRCPFKAWLQYDGPSQSISSIFRRTVIVHTLFTVCDDILLPMTFKMFPHRLRLNLIMFAMHALVPIQDRLIVPLDAYHHAVRN